MSNLGTVPGAGQPWKQQYDFNTEVTPSDLVWSVGSSLPDITYGSRAIVTKNRVYLLGGNNFNIVYTALINEDGTLKGWTTATSLPRVIYGAQTIVTTNRVFLLGGNINGSWSNVAYTALINEDGTLGTWTTITSLPVAIGESQVVVTKNKVHLLGGLINGNSSSAIYTACINKNGTLGNWVISGCLPDIIHNSQSIVTKNRIYLLGGNINGSWSNVAYTALINEDGTFGEWSVANSLPVIIGCSQSIVTRNRVYLLGGIIDNSFSSVTYTAPVNKDGILGKWSISTSLPGTVVNSQVIVTKGKIYLLGGYVNENYSNKVYMADLPGGLNDYTEFY